MIKSEIKTYTYPNNEIQRVQIVNLENWDDLMFFKPNYSKESYNRLVNLYQNFIVKQYEVIFGTIVLFRLPDDIKIPFGDFSSDYGCIYDKLVKVKIAFEKNISFNHKIIFKDKTTEVFFRELENRGCLKICEGKRNNITFLPVSDDFGFLSETQTDSSLRFNTSFFTMDKFDCSSVYDYIGIPLGLAVKDGKVLNPPLFDREVLMVDKNDNVSITSVSLNDMKITIDGNTYINNENAVFYSRPKHIKTPSGGTDIIISGNKVVALKKGGKSEIPCSGYVIHTEDNIEQIVNTEVNYADLENIKLAIQVGNSVSVNGKKTDKFISSFSSLPNAFYHPYPPTFYPMNYKKDRAPRMVIGNDKNSKPVIIWFEGAGKFGYEIGKESCGASLMEVADICEDLGIVNGINLDGGGSAQILIDNKRELLISDRDAVDFSEQERAVAMGMYLK